MEKKEEEVLHSKQREYVFVAPDGKTIVISSKF